jgi:DNA helicase-2/ATP-dependent DNA helicase PcrA
MEAARTKASTPKGTVLVIGDSTNPKGQQQTASQTPGATTVEAVDLRDLTTFGRLFVPGKAGSLASLVTFASELMTNLGAAELHRRLDSLAKGTARKEPTAAEAAALAFAAAPSYGTALEALHAFEDGADVRVYRPEVLHVCKAAMRAAASGESTFYEAVVKARERNRHIGRPTSKRAVGSTLLLKGLEADVVVVLNPPAMNAQHLYVALTRGARALVVCSQTPVLTPAH